MTAKMKEKISQLCPEISGFSLEDKLKLNLMDNLNTISSVNSKDDYTLKKKIDKLNFKFFLETDKFLNFKSELEKAQDNLFVLLFKQISVYIEEIERLNNKLKDREDNERFNKNKTDVAKKEIYDKEVINYKRSLKELERKMIDKSINEEKLKKENESFKRQIQFYKDKLKIELTNKRNKTPLKTSLKKPRFQETESDLNLDNERILDRKSLEQTPEKINDFKKPNDRSKNLTSTELYINPIKEQKNISTNKKINNSNLKKTSSTKPSPNRKIINNNFQNIYTLNITPLDDEIKTDESKTGEILECLNILIENINEEVEFLQGEEEYLNRYRLETDSENKSVNTDKNKDKKLNNHINTVTTRRKNKTVSKK